MKIKAIDIFRSILVFSMAFLLFAVPYFTFEKFIGLPNPGGNAHMVIPLAILYILLILSLESSLFFGLLVCNKYARGEEFEKSASYYLEIASLGFLISSLICFLLGIFFLLNKTGFILAFVTAFGFLFFPILSCVAYILSDLIFQGSKWKEDNDLTI